MAFPSISREHAVTHRDFFMRGHGQGRVEYLDGALCPLLAVDQRHRHIMDNLVQALTPQLKQSPCELLHNTMVGSGPTPDSTPTGQYSYAVRGAFVRPDVVIMDDRPSFFVPSNTVIVNPCAIVEVISCGEQDYMTGSRFAGMRQYLDRAFHAYMLILTERPEVACYTRMARDDWNLKVATDLHEVIALPRVGVTVTLAELYAGLRDKAGRPYVGPSTCPNCGHLL